MLVINFRKSNAFVIIREHTFKQPLPALRTTSFPHMLRVPSAGYRIYNFMLTAVTVSSLSAALLLLGVLYWTIWLSLDMSKLMSSHFSCLKKKAGVTILVEDELFPGFLASAPPDTIINYQWLGAACSLCLERDQLSILKVCLTSNG